MNILGIELSAGAAYVIGVACFAVVIVAACVSLAKIAGYGERFDDDQ